ncbi:ABC transporter substrate-binding protein [Tepiditoga spiralis]|uniref:ABC transporter substrate-binding protein n=1 Tax=Tepiditoga spiralis TaxID=2108365 RepID=A0A7G1G746_9BACT|nr:ABC transporter permease [Tepiditoga spiralis]BBE30747.1 ABC transporter substrate-binding protein [Tepiditoga spiralis]
MEILRETYRSLFSNKLRTFLSMLGIIIGITSVITVMALGAGTTENITNSVSSLGSNVMIIFPGYSGGRGGKVASSMNYLEKSDAENIANYAEDVIRATPVLQSNFLVQNGNLNITSTIMAGNPELFNILNLNIDSGRSFVEDDYANVKNYAIIGYTTAESLFEGKNPIGEKIYLIQKNSKLFRKIPFEVIGVLKKAGSTLMFNTDKTIFIPYSTADARLFKTNGKASMILASGVSSEKSLEAQMEVDFILNNKFGDDTSYQIMSQDSMLEVIGQITGVMNFILIAIAAISLVVGGIGIMNIMLVSVSERTREIGVKMALGAGRKRILLEFLTESIAITFIAGLIGIILGSLLSAGISSLAANLNLKAIISLKSILIAFGVSASVGLFFGIYPANKASKLSPIEALRYE